MRAKSMILIFIALACGLVASIGISQMLDTKGKKDVLETVEVLVAMTDVNIGEEFTESNVKLEAWPKNLVLPTSITSIDGIKGHYARQRFYPGEPLLSNKLMKSNEGPLSSIKIPEGYRVMSVKVSMEKVVSNLIVPGDRVDIIVFLKQGNGITVAISKTVLSDVRVFAVNSETKLNIEEDGKKIPARAVSLLVTPDQSEILDMADNLGQLRLSLRRPDDEELTLTGGMTAQDLLNPNTPSSDRESVGNTTPEQGFLEMLAGGGKQTPSGPEAPSYQWKTVVLDPTGSTVFGWRDENELPEQVSSSAAEPSSDEDAKAQDGESSPVSSEETGFTEEGE